MGENPLNRSTGLRNNTDDDIVYSLKNISKERVLKDIIGYSRGVQEADGTTSTKLFMRGTPRYVAGSRFKYTPDYIDFTYNDLVNAISEAIDKQMAEDGAEYFTNEASNLYKDTMKELDFDELISQFNSIINSLIASVPEEEFVSYWQPRIVQITDKYLGKGMKVTQCSRDQVEALDLIVTDLNEMVAQLGSVE